jgi:hypothetical protein
MGQWDQRANAEVAECADVAFLAESARTCSPHTGDTAPDY